MTSILRPSRSIPALTALLVLLTASAHAQGLARQWLAAEGMREGWDPAAQRAVFVGRASIGAPAGSRTYATERAAAAERAMQDARSKAVEWLGAQISAQVDSRQKLEQWVDTGTAEALQGCASRGFLAQDSLSQVTRVAADAALVGFSPVQTFESFDGTQGSVEVVAAFSRRFVDWATVGGSVSAGRGPRGLSLDAWFASIPDAELVRTFGTRFIADEQGAVHLVAFGQTRVAGGGEMADQACSAAQMQSRQAAALAVAGSTQSRAFRSALQSLSVGSSGAQDLPERFRSAERFEDAVRTDANAQDARIRCVSSRTVKDADSGATLCVSACEISLKAAASAPSASGGCPPVPPEMQSAVRQVQAEGRGRDLPSAVASALKLAIEQDGVKVDANAVLRRQYDTAMQRVNDEVTEKVTAQSTMKDEVKTFSSGFVHSFRVLNQSQDGGMVTASICANLIRFDPKNPRFGLPPTVAVVTVRGRPGTVSVGGQPQPVDAFARLAERGPEKVLAQSGRFIVIDERLQPMLRQFRDRIGKQGERGEVPVMELLKLGQALTADFLLVIELDEATFSGPAGPRPALEPRDTASAKISASLLNVGSNGKDWSEQSNVLMSARDVLLVRDPRERTDPEEANLAPAEIAAYRAARQIADSLQTHLGGTKGAAGTAIRVVRVSRASKEITLEAGNPAVRVGARFTIENLVEVELAGGRKVTDRDRVATVEVTAVSGELAKARVTDGDIDLIEAGKSEATPAGK